MNVTITKDAYDEYRVPGPDGREATAYYTDDKDDAIDTAKRPEFYDCDVIIKIRRVEEHPVGRKDRADYFRK